MEKITKHNSKRNTNEVIGAYVYICYYALPASSNSNSYSKTSLASKLIIQLDMVNMPFVMFGISNTGAIRCRYSETRFLKKNKDTVLLKYVNFFTKTTYMYNFDTSKICIYGVSIFNMYLIWILP
jgi:hypothetical protein